MNEMLTTTIENLNKNNIETFYVDSKDRVVDLLETLVPHGSTVSAGGSMSLYESGVIDYLESGKFKLIDKFKNDSEYYFCSSNAVTKNGELYNVDGRSNRVAAIAYGPKNVIMVVSVNKIVNNLDEAIKRVKTIAAPKNCVRLNCDTYCKATGYCEAIAKSKTGMTDGCKSKARICCNYLVSALQREKNRIKVIFVEENLGY